MTNLMNNKFDDARNRQLCELVKLNDLRAETKLLLANEGLIVRIAADLEASLNIEENHFGGIERDDILQEGRIALLTAAKEFDPTRENKFSTYAYVVVRRKMLDLCEKGFSSFEKDLWEDGVIQVFLDENPIDDDGIPLVETISYEGMDTGSLAVLHVMLEKMNNRLKMLPDRERRILIYHFGIGALEGETIARTAAYYHYTEDMIRAIEKNALKKLRDGMNDGKII